MGSRALGNRSILASPEGDDIQRIVNQKIKFREAYRPFAPAVLQEHADEYFDLPKKLETIGRPEYAMLSICSVKEKWRTRLPAVTHIDGSARVQLVTHELNPVFYPA